MKQKESGQEISNIDWITPYNQRKYGRAVLVFLKRRQ